MRYSLAEVSRLRGFSRPRSRLSTKSNVDLSSEVKATRSSKEDFRCCSMIEPQLSEVRCTRHLACCSIKSSSYSSYRDVSFNPTTVSQYLPSLSSSLKPLPTSLLNSPPINTNMQITDLLILGLAAFVAADCDENSNDGTDCTSTGTATVTRTSTDVNGIVLTNLETSTSVIVQSSLVPVFTVASDSSTAIDVNTERSTIRETTDIGTTATNTIVQVATTTDVGLAGGYAYTTNSNGSTIATYTGSDDSQPRTSSITTSTVAAGATAANNNDDGDDAEASATETETTSDSFALATAVPYFGAAAMAGLAFIV